MLFRPNYLSLDKGYINDDIEKSVTYSNTAFREMYINTGSSILYIEIYTDKY